MWRRTYSTCTVSLRTPAGNISLRIELLLRSSDLSLLGRLMGATLGKISYVDWQCVPLLFCFRVSFGRLLAAAPYRSYKVYSMDY